MNARAINVEHTQQNKLFKHTAKNSQNCLFGEGPTTEPLSNIPELDAKQIAKWETTEGLLEDVYEITFLKSLKALVRRSP